MTDERFRLGQYVRIGYRAWVNQLGGPVGDKKSIDQLEADYRAMQPRRQSSSPRPPQIHVPGAPMPSMRSKGLHKTKREPRGNGRVE